MAGIARKITILCTAMLPALAVVACSDGGQPQAENVAPQQTEAVVAPSQDLLPITLDAGNRSLTKLPLIIAWDQNLFEKHGLEMNLLIPGPDFEGGKEIPALYPDAAPEAWFRGGTPTLLRAAQTPGEPHIVDIGSTDCAVRAHVVGRMGIDSEIHTLDDLRGRRIGVSGIVNTLGYQARLLAQRMGWDYQTDFTIVDVENDGLEELADGSVDVILVNEIAYSDAKNMGYPVLFDLSEWGADIAGNSVAVNPGFLDDPVNREKGRRLMMAIAEAISIFHQQPGEVRRILREWNGVEDDAVAQDIMESGAWLPPKPYACVAGLEKTVELFPDVVQGRVTAAEFYDNSIMDEIDASGFLDELYN
jgi:ABC-type nitrate/sulfonate/bicarbonate transport system substrate-binding protein